MFGKMKDLYKLQSQAKKIKKELKKIHVEAEENGIVVNVSAEKELVSIDIPADMLNAENKSRIEKSAVSAINKASKKAEEIAAEKMKGVMGDMGFPGM